MSGLLNKLRVDSETPDGRKIANFAERMDRILKHAFLEFLKEARLKDEKTRHVCNGAYNGICWFVASELLTMKQLIDEKPHDEYLNIFFELLKQYYYMGIKK